MSEDVYRMQLNPVHSVWVDNPPVERVAVAYMTFDTQIAFRFEWVPKWIYGSAVDYLAQRKKCCAENK